MTKSDVEGTDAPSPDGSEPRVGDLERFLRTHRAEDPGPYGTIVRCLCGLAFEGADVFGSRHLWESHRARLLADHVDTLIDEALLDAAYRAEGALRDAPFRIDEDGARTLDVALGATIDLVAAAIQGSPTPETAESGVPLIWDTVRGSACDQQGLNCCYLPSDPQPRHCTTCGVELVEADR